nr:choline dehydrogenase, mitochondrial-like [Nerophis lumbriciformis]
MSEHQPNRWDYIIIGAGSAGCVLANRLSADPNCRVLLLEAGQSDRRIASRVPAAIGSAIMSPKMNWQYEGSPDTSRANRSDMWPAGKMLGGGSSLNGMMFVRGHRWDYDHWAQLGNPGWDYQSVLPYFRKLENNERGADAWRGVHGPLSVSNVRVPHPLTEAFVAAMTELGVERNADLNGENQEGVDYCQVTQKRGFRHSTASAYLDTIKRRPNLKITTGTLATHIGFDYKRASWVDYQLGNVGHSATTSRGIVVCAGAIASPCLLQRSGVGDVDHLKTLEIPVVTHRPGVGHNLQEHPGMIVSAHVNQRTLTSDRNPLRAVGHGLNYLVRGRGPLSNPVGHAQAFVRTRENLPAPNIQIIFSPLSYDHHEGGATAYPKPAINLAVGLCRVASRGEIQLSSNDPQEYPSITYALLDEPDDVRQLMEGIRFTRRLYDTQSFGSAFVDERKPGAHVSDDEALEQCIREQSFLMYHPCGTCAMGTGPEAVVDAQLKVHGVQGLWVADASVFPTIPAGNINASSIMVGEKAADLILAQQKKAAA